MSRVTTTRLRTMKRDGELIAVLTAYDYSFARLVDAAGVDVVLVGDSLGNVVQGQATTLPVTLDDMVYHTLCVSRGLERALLVADLPFLSYQRSPEQALDSGGRLMKEGLAQVVKVEGGEFMAPTVRFLVERGLPVCGHIGLTPQAVHALGGFRVQGRESAAAERLRRDALALQEAGACMLVVEAVPDSLGRAISEALEIPVIGIGAGAACDGQVLVLQDMLGMSARAPRFARDFLAGSGSIAEALERYVRAVRERGFPGADESYGS